MLLQWAIASTLLSDPQKPSAKRRFGRASSPLLRPVLSPSDDPAAPLTALLPGRARARARPLRWRGRTRPPAPSPPRTRRRARSRRRTTPDAAEGRRSKNALPADTKAARGLFHDTKEVLATMAATTERAELGNPVYQAYMLLRVGFTVAPILFGLDKFFNWTVDWTRVPGALGERHRPGQRAGLHVLRRRGRDRRRPARRRSSAHRRVRGGGLAGRDRPQPAHRRPTRATTTSPCATSG